MAAIPRQHCPNRQKQCQNNLQRRRRVRTPSTQNYASTCGMHGALPKIPRAHHPSSLFVHRRTTNLTLNDDDCVSIGLLVCRSSTRFGNGDPRGYKCTERAHREPQSGNETQIKTRYSSIYSPDGQSCTYITQSSTRVSYAGGRKSSEWWILSRTGRLVAASF
jgi:hypothetical protein